MITAVSKPRAFAALLFTKSLMRRGLLVTRMTTTKKGHPAIPPSAPKKPCNQREWTQPLRRTSWIGEHQVVHVS
jgi:hypothetical protein